MHTNRHFARYIIQFIEGLDRQALNSETIIEVLNETFDVDVLDPEYDLWDVCASIYVLPLVEALIKRRIRVKEATFHALFFRLYRVYFRRLSREQLVEFFTYCFDPNTVLESYMYKETFYLRHYTLLARCLQRLSEEVHIFEALLIAGADPYKGIARRKGRLMSVAELMCTRICKYSRDLPIDTIRLFLQRIKAEDRKRWITVTNLAERIDPQTSLRESVLAMLIENHADLTHAI